MLYWYLVPQSIPLLPPHKQSPSQLARPSHSAGRLFWVAQFSRHRSRGAWNGPPRADSADCHAVCCSAAQRLILADQTSTGTEHWHVQAGVYASGLLPSLVYVFTLAAPLFAGSRTSAFSSIPPLSAFVKILLWQPWQVWCYNLGMCAVITLAVHWSWSGMVSTVIGVTS